MSWNYLLNAIAHLSLKFVITNLILMALNLDVPFALASIYSTPQANEPILLYQGTVEIQVESQKVATGEGNIYLNWLPSPEIKIKLDNVILEIPVQDFKDRAWINKVLFFS